MANETFLFGQRIPAVPLEPGAVNDVLVQARAAQLRAAQVSIADLLTVLGRVSRLWANPEHPLRRRAERELPGQIAFSPAMVEEGLKAVVHLCSRRSLEQRMAGELGTPAALDGWVPRPGSRFDLRAVPRGPVLHLAAGNVFVGAVDSLVSGIVTKNANVLKMSHADPLFPVLFLESLQECDPEGLIWPNQAILRWKGGDQAVETPLLTADLTVVFWGGREALAAIQSRIGPGTRLIENGPRYSFAVAEGAVLRCSPPERYLEGLARDVAMWDQQACSSPHVVYVIDTDDEVVFRLMDDLVKPLRNLARTLPLGPLAFDEKVEIRKVRELAVMAEIQGHGRLVCPETFEFSLIFETDPSFKVSCLNRTLFFKRVSSLAALAEQVVPLRSYLQTVGLLIGPDLCEPCEAFLLKAGAKRLTQWGGMHFGCDGAPHEGSYLLSHLVDWVDREHLPDRDSRIQRFLEHVREAPLYAERLTDGDSPMFPRLERLPLLDRQTIYDNSLPHSTGILTRPAREAFVYASGGTTGDPKFVLYANDEWQTTGEILAFIYRMAGITEQDVVGNLFLAGNLWTSFSAATRALEMIGCLNMPIGGGSDLDNIIKYLDLFKVSALVGLPSIIIKLAEELRRRNLRLPVRKILYGGEHLRPEAIEFLKGAFDLDWARSAGYASVDAGPIGFQCPFLPGAVHHVLEEHQCVEILDPETGSPREIPSSGAVSAPGEITATNLYRRLMPVVRYRTGDLGRWVAVDHCPCGFTGGSFELLGRCDDMLVIGGINLMPSDIAPGLAGLSVSPSFQMIGRTQGSKDLLVLRLEAETPSPEAEVLASLQRGSYKIEEALRDGWLTVKIEWFAPGALPHNPRTGKLRVVIDERVS
jgi:phenylacetate-coenzyme A ligase PaaK-like adenylate-forming protein